MKYYYQNLKGISAPLKLRHYGAIQMYYYYNLLSKIKCIYVYLKNNYFASDHHSFKRKWTFHRINNTSQSHDIPQNSSYCRMRIY